MNIAALNGAPEVNAGELLITLIDASASVLVHCGVCANREDALVHLAAMVLSPDTGPVASLLPRLQAEFARLNDGKWIS